jgi:hypothetical protein
MTEDLQTCRPPRPWQFSLRALLLVMLLICTFFAGRYSGVVSMQPDLQRARDEADLARKTAEQASQHQLKVIKFLPQPVEPIWNIDKGMQIDALEQQKRIGERLRLEVSPQEP